MTDRLQESISAIMDGEADELELRRVLNEVIEDPELCAKWERYHLIRSYLHGDHLITSNDALKQSIHAELEIEIEQGDADSPELGVIDSGTDGSLSATGTWGGRVTAFAVAAGVALAVVVGFSLNRQEPSDLPQVAQVQITPVQSNSTSAAVFSDVPTQQDIERARAYMLHHTQQSAMNNPPGAIPFVKMAAYRSQ